MKTVFSIAAMTLVSKISAEVDCTAQNLGVQDQLDCAIGAAGADENGDPRAILSMIGEEAFANIDGYGCWCYFDDSFGKGKSHPVDEADAFCKVLHEGYECIMIDNDSEGEEDSCIPWEAGYVPAAVGETDDIISQCHDRNADFGTCAIRSCMVESQFVTSMFRFLISGGAMNTDNNHSNGFDVEANCPTVPGHASEKDCCGHYPYRHPFKTYGGQRSCCGMKTFDISVLQCCANGKVRVNC